MDDTWSCFYALAMVNNIVNEHGRADIISRQVFSLDLHKHPEDGLLDPLVILVLMFWELYMQFSLQLHQVYIPINSEQGLGPPLPPTSPPKPAVSCFLIPTTLTGANWCCGSELFPWWSVMLGTYLHTGGNFACFFGKISIHFLSPLHDPVGFFVFGVLFLVIWVIR